MMVCFKVLSALDDAPDDASNSSSSALAAGWMSSFHSLMHSPCGLFTWGSPAEPECVLAAAEEYGLQMMSNPVEDGACGSDAPAPVPMLHMWVDAEMTLQAVRQSMHNFVAAPQGRQWQLSLAKVSPGAHAPCCPSRCRVPCVPSVVSRGGALWHAGGRSCGR